MKKLTLLFLFVLTCVCTRAAELYTVWDHNSYTLTFYYDNNRTSSTGDDVVLIEPGTNYWAQYGTLVDKIVMDASIKNYQPTTLKEFFQNPTYTIWFRNVRSITNLSYLNTANATSMERMFENMMSLKSVDLSNFNTAKVTSMYRMFANCMALNEVNLTQFNASKVTTTGGMFSGCEKLNSITWGDGFKTNMIEYAAEMFYGCKNLYSMDLSRFNLTINKSFLNMFGGCETLTTVAFGSYKQTAAQSYGNMFENCTSLDHINLDNFVFSNITSTSGIFMMFANCSSLKTITCSQDLTTMPKIANTTHLFDGCTSLKGDNGTKFSTSHVDASYARPDRGTAQPGYFSAGLEPIAVCETPTNVTTSNIGTNEVTIDWTAASGQQAWYIQYSYGYAMPQTVYVYEHPYRLTGLSANKTYTVSVQASCGIGNLSEWSSTVNFTTLDNPTPPECAMPTNVKVEDITSTSAKVTWTPGGTESGWEVSYMKKGGAYQMRAGSPSQPTFVLEGLEPMIEYNVYVRAVCGVNNNSEYAVRSFITSPEIVEECNAPTEMMTQILTDTKALVAWIPAGTETKWNFIYKRTADANYMYVTVTGDPYYELKDLEPNTSYSANVYAICSADSYSVWYNDGIDFTFTTRKAEGIDNLHAQKAATKILRDGQLLILVGDKTYDARGNEVR